MKDNDKETVENDDPVEFAEGVYWVGFYDPKSGLHCNPYLVIDGDEAVVIDGGSRPDFAAVMMKILRTGISPGQIRAMIYQHYDPDLCGSISNFEDIIDRKDLKIVSAGENLGFISHYATASTMAPIEDDSFSYAFSSGRTLQFTKTPFCHSAGSFVTFDPRTKVLFTSDLFGSYGAGWKLYLEFGRECLSCLDFSDCPKKLPDCPINDILEFHRKVMPSRKALRYAMERILKIPFEILAPQHGSIVKNKIVMKRLFETLANLKDVGIDGIVEDDAVFDFGDMEKRFSTG
jgi:flavorubredoxin